MQRWLLIPIMSMLFASCLQDGGAGPTPQANVVTVKYGTYFGFCDGYCRSEVTIDSAAVTLLRTSRNTIKFPDIQEHRATGASEWRELDSLASLGALSTLHSVIGCPDCADGGGEWIEVRRGNTFKRVVFDYGATIPQIRDLVARARAVRATFKD